MKKRAQLEYRILRHHQVYGTPIDDCPLPKWMQDAKEGGDKPVITKNRRGILKNVHKDILEKRRQRYQKNKDKIKANETFEAREKRLAYSRERMRALYKSAKTANETPGERNDRLEKSRLRSLKRYESETVEDRNKRLENAKIYQKNKIANETVEQYRIRIRKNRECFLRRLNKSKQSESEENVNESEEEDKPSTSVPTKKPAVSRRKRAKKVEVVEEEENFSSEIVLIRESARNETLDLIDDPFIKEEPLDYDVEPTEESITNSKRSRTKKSTQDPTFEYDLDVSIEAPESTSMSLRTRKKPKFQTESCEEGNSNSDSDYTDPFKSSNFKKTADDSDDDFSDEY